MYYAVIDTNVVVSSMLKESSIPGIIMNEALTGLIIPIYNQEILQEYEEVLLRNEFGFTKHNVNKLIEKIKTRGLAFERLATEENLLIMMMPFSMKYA